MNITSTAYCQRWHSDIEEQALSLSAFHEILADTQSKKKQPMQILRVAHFYQSHQQTQLLLNHCWILHATSQEHLANKAQF